MPYNKQTWTDAEDSNPDQYLVDGEVKQIEKDESGITTPGTLNNAARMNYIEDGIEGATNTAESAQSKSNDNESIKTATLNGRVLEITQASFSFANNKVVRVEVPTVAAGTKIQVQMNSDTALDLEDSEGADILELEAGYYTFIAKTGTPNFFELAPQGGGSEPFYGDESNGALNTTGNVTLTSTLNGPAIIRQHTDITINTGHTLTVSNPCQGLVLYATGNVVIDGEINMNQKAGVVPSFAAIDIAALSSDELTGKIVALLSTLKGGSGGNGGDGGSSNLAGAGTLGPGGTANIGRLLQGGFGAGGGGAATSTNANGGSGGDISLPEIGNGKTDRNRVYNVNASYVAGSDGNDGYNGAGATSGTNVDDSVGNFGAGAGGRCLGGGGGASGGTVDDHNSSDGQDGQYSAGFLCIIAKGSITINGVISSNGGDGGDGTPGIGSGSIGGGGGGGASGGGVISIFHKGTYTNNGTIQVNAGSGGASGGGAGTPAQPGQSGSIGTISVNDVNNL